ncbi:uncharacterized protein CCR75_006188 [Bremia lactucae]|uniref:Secreted protein n=1 Tax=Bremia lactucae TaxID=4779 RepID=A0A976FGW9_BRELC|nr:hypothetical protein CCR75_006188 [Bremia lactucae]
MKFFICSAIALAAAASAENAPEPTCISGQYQDGPYYFISSVPAPPARSCLSMTANRSTAISWNVDFSLPGIVDDTYWSESHVSLSLPSVKMEYLQTATVKFEYTSFQDKDLSAIAHITMLLQANVFDRGSLVVVMLCQSGPDPTWLGIFKKEVQVDGVSYSLFEGYVNTMLFQTFVPKSCTTAYIGNTKAFLNQLGLSSSHRLATIRAGFMIRSGVDAVLNVNNHYMTYTAAVDPSP